MTLIAVKFVTPLFTIESNLSIGGGKPVALRTNWLFFGCFLRIFIGKMVKASVAAGKNVIGTQGSPKKWSELLSKCEKSEKKAVFYGVTRQPGNVLKEVDTWRSEI